MIEVTEQIKGKFLLAFLCNGKEYKLVYLPLFIGKLGLPKTFSSYKDIDKWFLKNELKIGKSYLLYLLGRQDYLKAVLVRKLKEKKFSIETIDTLIYQFIDLGYVDDDKLTKKLVAKEMLKGKGPKFIFAKLKSKGIDRKIIEKHLQKSTANVYQIEKVQNHLLTMKGLERNKIYHKLYRLGFDNEIIKQCLEENGYLCSRD